MTITINPIRRTFVLTVGDLANGAAHMMEAKITEQQGVETAVAIIQANAEGENGSEFTTQLSETLTRISPPKLSQILSAAGWRLVEPRMMHLILLVDIAPDMIQMVQALAETAVSTIYHHLGLDSKVTLIWLAANMDTDTEACVQNNFSFSPQVIALSPLNEDGLRLPETETLSQTAAELVWCLTCTPFHQYLAESLAAIEDVYTGHSPVTTMGLAVWEWSQTAVYEALIRRWRDGVFSRWLDESEPEPTPEIVSAWLQQQQLDRESVKTHIQSVAEAAIVEKRFTLASDYERTARHWPWPWVLNKQIVRLKELYQADGTHIAVFKQNAEQQLHLLKEAADETLSNFLTQLLDTRPVGGINTAVRWTWALQLAWDERYERMQDEAAAYDGIDQDLAEERGLIDGEIREWQEGWPGAPWSRWLPHSWRLWHWPQLIWHYWQLRKLGSRLAGILAQQSGRRRQKAVDSLVAKTMSELARQGRQWHGRVEEVQDMLNAYAEKHRRADGNRMKDGNCTDVGQNSCIAAAELVEAKAVRTTRLRLRQAQATAANIVMQDEENETAKVKRERFDFRQTEGLEIKGLSLDLDEEATAAAETIGGLGRQLKLLDDEVLQNLDTAAKERLQGVWAVTAVDLLQSLHTTPEAWQTWWQSMSHMAAPLWCYDEGLLSEADRMYQWTGSCLLGAGVERVPALRAVSHDNGAAAPETAITRLPSADHSRLIVIRIRHGATVGTRMVNYER